MISKNLKHQLAYFTNGPVPAVTPEVIMRLMSLNLVQRLGLIPSTVQELDGLSMRPIPRLSLQSPTTGISINFLSSRVDVIAQIGAPGAERLDELSGFMQVGVEILSLLVNEFKIKSNRLALISEAIIDAGTTREMDAIRDRLFPSKFTPFDDANAFEWNYRVVNKAVLGFGSDEIVNQIASLNRMEMQIPEDGGLTPLDAIVLAIDLNTVPQNTDTRFDGDNISGFFNAAIEAYVETLKVIQGEIYA